MTKASDELGLELDRLKSELAAFEARVKKLEDDMLLNAIAASAAAETRTSPFIDPAPVLNPVVITSSPITNGCVGCTYSETLTAEGGDGTNAWALFNSTTLPAGLSLNASTGEISGTPTASGTTNFEVEVTSGGATDNKALIIIVSVTGDIGVTSVSRDVGSAAGGSVVVITGFNFVSGAVASFGGADATTTVFNSSTQLTATTAAHAVGRGDVKVTNPDTGNDTLSNGFEYLTTPTTMYASHDFEDNTLGDFHGEWAVPVTGEWGWSVSGTFAVRARKKNTGDGAGKLVYSRAGEGAPSNPPLESTGVFQRWYQYMPQGSMDAAATGQIKFLLNRGSGRWLMGIVGREAPGDNDEAIFLRDADTGGLSPSTGFVVKNRPDKTGFNIPPDEWVEFQTWFFHDGTNGRARVWINGKEMFDVTDPLLGTSDSSGVYDWETGVAWVQNNSTAFHAIVYVDDAAMANGYIEP